ncbi:MAG TPA: hypothetical protein VEI96_00915 [Thermodesulfovibrionales bacterium]|nr:hypothetical protein [Thermodesulfovibrionales bacterium]
MKDPKRIIRRDRVLSEIFDSCPGSYLVGGYVRDIIRGAESTDIDFVVRGNFSEIASSIALGYKGKYIDFAGKGMARVIIGRRSIDFTELRGEIEEDLERRDFTMNAIAWSPDRGIVDPLKGSHDISSRLIRGISRKNFVDDPLRLLRAYRFSGELCWTIDSKTRALIGEMRSLIREPANERITLELFRLLESKCSMKGLKAASSDGLLGEILYLDNRRLQDCIQELSLVNAFLKKIPERYNFKFGENVSQELSYGGVLRAIVLLSGADKRRWRLSLSRTILDKIEAFNKLREDYPNKGRLRREEIFDGFVKEGDSLVDFAILSRNLWNVRESLRCMNMRPLLRTEEIMRQIGVKGGPELGLLKRDMMRMQFLLKLKSVSDARQWLGTMA